MWMITHTGQSPKQTFLTGKYVDDKIKLKRMPLITDSIFSPALPIIVTLRYLIKHTIMSILLKLL